MANRDVGRYEEQEPLTPEELAALTAILHGRRDRIISDGEETMETIRSSGGTRMSDEVDMASAEYDQAFEHRIRDREQHLLKKVDKALLRIVEGEYGECENCGNYIGYKRLSARPEASMCIECKEEQERVEKKYKKRRPTEAKFPFK